MHHHQFAPSAQIQKGVKGLVQPQQLVNHRELYNGGKTQTNPTGRERGLSASALD